jgi:hypothetical protein
MAEEEQKPMRTTAPREQKTEEQPLSPPLYTGINV